MADQFFSFTDECRHAVFSGLSTLKQDSLKLIAILLYRVALEKAMLLVVIVAGWPTMARSTLCAKNVLTSGSRIKRLPRACSPVRIDALTLPRRF